MRTRSLFRFSAFILVAACANSINPFDDPLNAPDLDGDGHGSALQGGTDCDDGNAAVNPDAQEVCADGIDNNCDGLIDDTGQGSITWYQDLDGDSYGNPDVRTQACPDSLIGKGFTTDDTDCNDTQASVNPGATSDPCNGLDDDCDTQIDEDGLATFNGTAYPTIADAMARAGAFDGAAVVEVCGSPLPYEVEPLLVGKAEEITLRSNPQGTTAALTQPQGGTILRVREGGRLTIQDMVLQGSDSSAALIVETGGELTLLESELKSNPSGALRLDGTKMPSRVLAIDTAFRTNGKSTLLGGAIQASGDFDLELQNCTVAQNTGADGAGIWTDGPGTVALSNTLVEENEGMGVGGGLYIDGALGLTLTKSTIRDNTAMDGAGIALFDTTVTGDSASVVSENQATEQGGGLYLVDSSVAGIDVSNNEAVLGGGVFASDTASAATVNALTSTTVANNTAKDGAGVAMAFLSASRLVTDSCAFDDNVASGAGGAFLVDFATGRNAVLDVRDGTFLRNFPADIEYTNGFGPCAQSSDPSDFLCSWAGCTVCLPL